MRASMKISCKGGKRKYSDLSSKVDELTFYQQQPKFFNSIVHLSEKKEKKILVCT